jgi:hypothetical protein
MRRDVGFAALMLFATEKREVRIVTCSKEERAAAHDSVGSTRYGILESR